MSRIKNSLVLTILFLGLTSLKVSSQDIVPTADDIMKEALQKASTEGKSVFLMFHASWCGWCKKMDASMTDESCKDFFDNNFVTIHMVVKESEDKKHLENPGAAELMAKYGGARSGIPFWLIFDHEGNLKADSFKRPEGASPTDPGSNIGCPATDEEVAAFIDKLKSVTSVSMEEMEAITARFKQNR